jgi:hypothetical protein
MKKKLLALFLSIAFIPLTIQAKIGDTYICQMGEYWTNYRGDFGFKQRVNESFIFERGSNYIKISSKPSSMFADGLFDVYHTTESENFKAEGWQTLISYHNNSYGGEIKETGWFNYVELHNFRGVTTATATCYISK